MKLYVCQHCNSVAAFYISFIEKHDLERPEMKTCPVCNTKETYRLLYVDPS